MNYIKKIIISTAFPVVVHLTSSCCYRYNIIVDGSMQADSIAGCVKSVAEAAMHESQFIYDSETGLYYDYVSGQYYDAVCIKCNGCCS